MDSRISPAFPTIHCKNKQFGGGRGEERVCIYAPLLLPQTDRAKRRQEFIAFRKRKRKRGEEGGRPSVYSLISLFLSSLPLSETSKRGKKEIYRTIPFFFAIPLPVTSGLENVLISLQLHARSVCVPSFFLCLLF